MPPNPFDQACRYLLRRCPGLLLWLLGATEEVVLFVRWLHLFLVTLLGYAGHRLLEAGDGVDEHDRPVSNRGFDDRTSAGQERDHEQNCEKSDGPCKKDSETRHADLS